MKESSAFRYMNTSVFFHFIGRQLYSIFVPVIMLQNGYSLNLVLLFLLLSSGVTILTSYLGQKIVQGRNVLYFNIAAIISEILLLLVLNAGEFTKLYFLLIVMFEGIYYAFYYISYYAITIHYTSTQNSGLNLGNLTISSSSAALVAPLIGSFILSDSRLGLIVLGIMLLLISLIPLLKLVGREVEEASSPGIELKDISRELVNYGINASFEVVAFVLWGVFVYINDFSLLSIGLIPVAVAGSRILLAQNIKTKIDDTGKRKNIMLAAVTGIMAVSLYRYLVPEHVVVTNILIALFYVGFQLGVQKEAIDSMKGGRTYYSSMLLQITTFAVRIPIIVIALLIGLENILLLPIPAGIFYIYLNYLSPRIMNF